MPRGFIDAGELCLICEHRLSALKRPRIVRPPRPFGALCCRGHLAPLQPHGARETPPSCLRRLNTVPPAQTTKRASHNAKGICSILIAIIDPSGALYARLGNRWRQVILPWLVDIKKPAQAVVRSNKRDRPLLYAGGPKTQRLADKVTLRGESGMPTLRIGYVEGGGANKA